MSRHRPGFWVVFAAVSLTVSAACAGIGIELKGDPLNPELHRAKLVAIDAIVFEDGELSPDDAMQLETLLLSLSEIASADPANTIAVIHGKELKTVAAHAKSAAVGKMRINSPLRLQWLRIRSSLFDDAWWFRRSSADPIEPAVAAPPPPSPLRPATPEERAALELIVPTLEQIAELAKRNLINGYDTVGYREFAAIAKRDLAVVEARLPADPPAWGIDLAYTSAHRYVSEALRNAKTLAGLGVGAPRSSREYLIGKIGAHTRRARELMADMRR